jgi:hypothetical protein
MKASSPLVLQAGESTLQLGPALHGSGTVAAVILRLDRGDVTAIRRDSDGREIMECRRAECCHGNGEARCE